MDRAGRSDVYVLDVGASSRWGSCLLLVEDNAADARLAAKALEQAGWTGSLLVACDGREALDLLFGRARSPIDARPALVLLDLNLPGVSGREVLDAIRAHPEHHALPVIVLSTSEDRGDVRDAYARRANAYVTKPLDFSRFEQVAQHLVGFWLDAVELP